MNSQTTNKMRKVSELLELAISSGYYKYSKDQDLTNGNFMCVSMSDMKNAGLITHAEMDMMHSRLRKQVITVYLNRVKSGKAENRPRVPAALATCFVREDKRDAYFHAFNYYKKWIRDLKRRGN